MADDKKEAPAPESKGRSVKDVSKDLQTAGFNESPELPPEPHYPEPDALTPEELKQPPDEVTDIDPVEEKD